MRKIFSVHPSDCSELAWETHPAAKAENEYSRFLSESLQSCHPASRQTPGMGWTQSRLTINELLIVFSLAPLHYTPAQPWLYFYTRNPYLSFLGPSRRKILKTPKIGKIISPKIPYLSKVRISTHAPALSAVWVTFYSSFLCSQLL